MSTIITGEYTGAEESAAAQTRGVRLEEAKLAQVQASPELQPLAAQHRESLDIKLEQKRKSHEPAFPTEEKMTPDPVRKRPSTRNGHPFATP